MNTSVFWSPTSESGLLIKAVDPWAAVSPATVSRTEARGFDSDLIEGVRDLNAELGKPVVAIGGPGFDFLGGA